MMGIKSFIDKFLKAENNEDRRENNSNCKNAFSFEIPKQYQNGKIFLMKELAERKETFCKISQSRPGRSAEDHYIEYHKNTIVTAIDSDEWLSFVPGSDIIKCLCYGDILTIFNFDMQNGYFMNIANDPVIHKGGMLNEYTAKNLLVKENCSLEYPETFVKIIELSSANSIWYSFIPKGEIADRIKDFGYVMTANFIKALEEKYNLQKPEAAAAMKDCIRDEYENWKEQIDKSIKLISSENYSLDIEIPIKSKDHDDIEL